MATAAPPKGGKKWLSAALVGALAVGAGVLLPLFLGPITPLPEAAAPSTRGTLDYVPPAWPEAPDPRVALGRLVGGTVFVLVLCVASLYLGRRWLRQFGGVPEAKTGLLSVVETLPLGPRASLHLVRVGRQRVLVGVDAAGIKAVTPLPDLFDEDLALSVVPSEKAA